MPEVATIPSLPYFRNDSVLQEFERQGGTDQPLPLVPAFPGSERLQVLHEI